MLIRDIKVQLNFVVLFTRNEDPPRMGYGLLLMWLKMGTYRVAVS